MIRKTLLCSRYQLHDKIFLEYLRGVGVFLDIGPYPSEPSDFDINRATDLLESIRFDFLELNANEWVLDLDQLTTAIPEIKNSELTGQLVHPPAFLVSGIFTPVRVLGRHAAVTDERQFLRIDFEFHPTEVLSEYDEESGPPSDWAPKIVS